MGVINYPRSLINHLINGNPSINLHALHVSLSMKRKGNSNSMLNSDNKEGLPACMCPYMQKTQNMKPIVFNLLFLRLLWEIN